MSMAANSWSDEPLTSSSGPGHDIFLSHSGAQKPFVLDLYNRLRTQYSTFFDIADHSLPLGEDFPSHIFNAARTCKLAVIVLSEEYLRSKWPMIELCAFVSATPPPKILPLFFKLGPNDLKDKQKVETWRSIWDEFAKENSRIVVSDWESALKALARSNGIVFKYSEGESSFIERVFQRICKNVPPFMRYDFSGFPGIHRMCKVVLNAFEELDVDQSKVCVLGMCGLPGSGKTTLCRYLCDYLFTRFSGKVVHLELPTNADDETLLLKAKELLKLTNFRDKIDLSNASHLRQVYYLLRKTDFSVSKVFLVVDNITSQSSQDFMKALLRLGLAGGSKVLMVAQYDSVLCPLLQGQGIQQNSLYVYGSVSAPDLSSEEALQVLLQFGDGIGLPDAHFPEISLTPRQQQVMEEVVQESRIGGQHFPLVLKIMGDHLRGPESVDVENWSRKMKRSFLGEVGLFKTKALKELVDERFRALSKNLQTLFLDVALFIVPLSVYLYGEIATEDEICSRLSAIQDRQPDNIKMEMGELRRHGFLDLWKGRYDSPVTVHDFYREFASSVEKASTYCWSSQAIGVARTNKKLRTVVLKLDEGEENYRFGPEYTSVKALVLRSCRSLKVLGGTENLVSLASLDLHNCPSLQWVQSPADGWKMHNLQWVTWQTRGCDAEMPQQQNLKASSLVRKKSIVNEFRECLSRMKFWGRPVMGIDGLLLRAKGLEILRLANTGFRHSVDLSGCLPQLRELDVWEQSLKRLRVCNLPNLESFYYSADVYSCLQDYCCGDVLSVPRKGVLTQRGLLEGCPKLQDVRIRCSSVTDGRQGVLIASPNLREVSVYQLWNVSRAPDLNEAAESLEVLQFLDCRDLTSLTFGCTYGNLRTLCLMGCPKVTEVTGLDGLPGLHELRIERCAGLEKVSGLGGLASLKLLAMSQCPNLHCHSWLSDLGSLTELEKVYCDDCGLDLMDGLVDVGGSKKLVSLELGISDNAFTAGKLKLPNSIWWIHLTETAGQITVIPVHAMTLLRLLAEPSQFSFCSISGLYLSGLRNLTSLEGIEFLGTLQILSLRALRNLTSLQGIESLRNLDRLGMFGCSSVEELPSLSALVGLRTLECVDCMKLSSVEGCGGLGMLRDVGFQGCKSLARFPLRDLKDWNSIWRLSMEGCKFASVEAAMAWAEDDTTAEVLRLASLEVLRRESMDWRIINNDDRRNACEMMLDRLLPKTTKTCLSSEEDTHQHHLFDYFHRRVLQEWNHHCRSDVSNRVRDLWNDEDEDLPVRSSSFDAFTGQPLAHHLPHGRARGPQVGFQPATSVMQAEPSTAGLTLLQRNTKLFMRLEEACWLAKASNRHFIHQCPDVPGFSVFIAYLFYCVPFFTRLLGIDEWW